MEEVASQKLSSSAGLKKKKTEVRNITRADGIYFQELDASFLESDD